MANRLMPNRQYASTRDRKIIDAKVTFGATGAPTLAANPFVKSVTRDAAGKFTFVFGNNITLDAYVALVGARVIFDTAAVTSGPVMPAAPFLAVYTNNIADNTKASLQVGLHDGDTPALTDPAEGEIGYFTFEFKDSGAL
jgi:hypothetical protein